MQKDELLKLAKRVEALTDKYDPIERGISKEIHRLLFGAPEPIVTAGYGWREDEGGWCLQTGEDSRIPPRCIYPPNWLRSLDAAITLVPKDWHTDIEGLNDSWTVNLVPTVYGAIGRGGAFACSPSLALCAAALRALAGGE